MPPDARFVSGRRTAKVACLFKYQCHKLWLALHCFPHLAIPDHSLETSTMHLVGQEKPSLLLFWIPGDVC